MCTCNHGRQVGKQRGSLPSSATHLIVVVHDHQMPETQGPEQLEYPWERRFLQCGHVFSSPASPD